MDTKNRHLVAIDVSAPNRLVVAMPPRGSLTRDEALTFAAWLITTADAASDPPQSFDARDLVDRARVERAAYDQRARAGTSAGPYLDSSDGVTIPNPATFFPLENARELAARLVAVAIRSPIHEDTAPFRAFFERVAAVHGVVHDGSELKRVLEEEGEKVDLKSPQRFRLVAPEKRGELADDAHAEDEVVTDAKKRALRP